MTLVAAWIQDLWDAWLQFWFTPRSTRLLDVIRIGLGLVLLTIYLGPAGDFFVLWGDDGWVSIAAARDFAASEWGASLLFYLSEREWQTAFFAIFLAACLAFTLGWRTRWVKWLVLVGHLSLLYRDPAIAYGLDDILACLLWVLCIAPLGRHLSLDCMRRRRLAKDDAPPSAWGNACLRLIQWQMAVVFFTAGAAKLQGESWLHGYALWDALVNDKYTNIPLTLTVLADQFWLVNLLTYATIVLQLAYPFLIWGKYRKWLLAEAITIHLGIAVFMGLYSFSTAMIFGHLAFTRECWLDALAQKWRERFGN